MNNALKSWFRRSKMAGYSLVEVIVVVALISAASAGAFFVISGVTKDSADTKLLRDVATINRAIGVYQASGGNLSDVSEPQAVIDRLKSKMTETEAKQMAGLRGSLVDTRLKAVLQDSGQAALSEQRAFWNPGRQGFYVANSGAIGVREFVLDESLAEVDYGTGARNSAFKLAVVKPWIWDTADGATQLKGKGGPRTNNTAPSTQTLAGSPGGPLQLRTPEFSINGGGFTLTDYPLKLTLTNPNQPNTSDILFAVNGGEWRVYGHELLINPMETVRAMSATIMPDKFSDSPVVRKTYTSTPVMPEIDLTFAQSAYSYLELGGLMLPNHTPGTDVAVAGNFTLTNAAAIPDAYESSAYFQLKWTKDGTDPFTGGTASTGADFANGFPGQQIPLTLADLGTNTQITIQAGFRTKNPAVFTNSPVIERRLTIAVLKLRPPTISVDGRDVTLGFDFSHQDVPEGAYIYYTTDGSDPGVSGGQPTSGQAYNAPFKLDGAAGSSITVVARVYPPLSYQSWFQVSDTARQSIQLPVGAEFYVGGSFLLANGVSGAGAPMRNIARLTGDGSVDKFFDVGSGASANSIVGVIRQTAAGSVFAGGDFETVNNVARPAVVRLNSDGSVDMGFDADLAGGKIDKLQANEGLGNGIDPNTPGAIANGDNDGAGTGPGNPGATTP